MADTGYREQLVKGLTSSTAGELPFSKAAANVELQQIRAKREEDIKEKDRLAKIESERDTRQTVVTKSWADLHKQFLGNHGYQSNFKEGEPVDLTEQSKFESTIAGERKAELGLEGRLKAMEMSDKWRAASVKQRENAQAYIQAHNYLRDHLDEAKNDTFNTPEDKQMYVNYSQRLNDLVGVMDIQDMIKTVIPAEEYYSILSLAGIYKKKKEVKFTPNPDVVKSEKTQGKDEYGFTAGETKIIKNKTWKYDGNNVWKKQP